MDQVKNIIFDLGGVIVNIDDTLTINALENLGVADPRDIFTLDQQGKLCQLFEVGKITPEYFCAALAQLTPNNITHKEIITAWNAMLLDIPTHRITMLKQVKEKYNIYLLSNTNVIHIRHINNLLQQTYDLTLEDLFIKTYYSFAVGLRKADVKLFQHVLTTNHLIPAETLFIDDLAQNILAAQSLGMLTLQAERNRFKGDMLLNAVL